MQYQVNKIKLDILVACVWAFQNLIWAGNAVCRSVLCISYIVFPP